MRTHVCLAAALVCLGQCLQANDARETVAAAVASLAAQPNYTWNTEQDFGREAAGARHGLTTGQTARGGFTCLKLTLGERQFEAVIKGDEIAVRLGEEWSCEHELEGRQAAFAQRLKQADPPAAEARHLLEVASELKAESDTTFTGQLTGQGVQELFHRWSGRRETAPKAMEGKGVVTFHVKSGQLTGYDYQVSAVLPSGQDQPRRETERAAKVRIEAAGTTELKVPEEALDHFD